MTVTQKKGGKRSQARLAVVQALYELDVSGTNPDSVIEEFLSCRWRDRLLDQEERGTAGYDPSAEPDQAFFSDLLKTASGQSDELGKRINLALKDEQTFERLEALLRAILQAGLVELMIHPETDRAVIVNEYVEVARAFYDQGPEVGLINAVLDRLAGEVTAQLPLQEPGTS